MARHVGSCDVIAVGICWGSSAVDDTLVILWCGVDTAIMSIFVLSVGRRTRSSAVMHRHKVRSVGHLASCQHWLIRGSGSIVGSLRIDSGRVAGMAAGS